MKKSVVRQELLRLTKLHRGKLKPEHVVQAAEPKNSVLHGCFEWDNTVAGLQYRLWQARSLIRVTVEYSDKVLEKVHTFVSLKSDRKTTGYRVLSEVLSDEEMRAQLLREALEDLNIFKKKYRVLQELSSVFEAIDRVTAQ